MNQEEKSKIVGELQESLKRSQVAIVSHYRGMTVAQLTDLRRKFRTVGAEYRVVKNTLARRAVVGTQFEKVSELLTGPTALTLSPDPVGPAKIMMDFVKSHPNLELRGAVMEGQLLGVADIQALSQLPPREVLLSRMLGAMKRPMQDIASVLGALPAGLARALEQVREQRSASES
ncbi:MAG: 50S ribosomal protein L10 [Magnetococcales bacterium]|nr:50S ribosomal protein L10 [Magnetococcales bacterium]NGZ28237.1 50S ribosomal protein L10 [Magnetococcales bacterium]